MNGKYELVEWIRAILLTIMCLIVTIGIALFIVVNLSQFFITFPTSLLKLGRANLLSDYRRVIYYLQLPCATLRLQYLPITESALRHFEDVKRLVLVAEFIVILLAPTLVMLLIKQKRQNQLWRMILPFQVMFILLLFSGFMGMTNFDTYFIQAHYLLFNNMDWVFNPQDNPIILLMPQEFFELLFGLWIGISLILLLLILGWIKIELHLFLRKL